MLLPFRRLNTLFKTGCSDLIGHQLQRLIKEIKALPDGNFEQSEADRLIENLISRYELLELPIIKWHKGTNNLSKVKITSKDLPSHSFATFEGEIERNRIDFFIPFEGGNHSLLVYRGENINYDKPFARQHSTIDNGMVGVPYVLSDEGRLIFTYIDFWGDINKINELFKKDKESFDGFHKGLSEAIKKYNENLPAFIQRLVGNRVSEIQKMDDYASKLPFPIDNSTDIPSSFRPKKVDLPKKIEPKPIRKSSHASETVEWFITDEDYKRILKILFDCSKMWEKYSRLYEGRDEESLRDQLLFVLVPNINAVVAGEAYNKKGKTDISIRHQNTNLFIGECKIWNGPKKMIETIDQILRYLTWRDSKAVVLNFVPNEGIKKVIASAEEAIESHECFVSKLKTIEFGWTNYVFKLSPNSDAHVKIAFQFIHTPLLK